MAKKRLKTKGKVPWIKPIPMYLGYYASREGEIFHLKADGNLYKLSGSTVHNGYLTVKIPDSQGIKHRRKVHRLVATTFLPNLEEDYNIVCHKDNNPLNNRVSNLYWGTQSMNMQQMVRDGRQRKSKAKSYFRKVRELLSYGFNADEIACKLGLSKTTTYRLIKNKNNKYGEAEY